MRAFHPTRWLVALAILLAAAQWQCTKKPTAPPDTGDLPGQPFGLSIAIGDQQIELSWAIDNPVKVKNYHIYRRDTTSAPFVNIATVLTTKFVDRNGLRNGVVYEYQISAVSLTGNEGQRSSVVSGVPNVFSLRINSGASFTASPQVSLELNAPASTTFMLIANDSTFAGSNWLPYARTLPWQLTNGDGVKTIYVKFRDGNGLETRTLASANIALDTIALILSVTENTNGNPKRAGETIHFTLDAGEPNGKAAVTVDGILQAITLYDDGRPGDKQAGNGIYEVDYIIPDDAEVTQALVRGSFTDRAGNVAAAGKTAPGKVTIVKPPASVTMFAPTLQGNLQNTLRLSWSAAPEADFGNYSIYKSTTANFTPAANLLLDRVSVKATTNIIDTDVQEGVTYYYRVLVFDTGGLASPSSNEVSGRIAINAPPTPVTLLAPQAGLDPTRQVILSWSQNLDADFTSYRVLRATSLPVDPNAAPLALITSARTTSYTDITGTPNTKYYYQVIVVDQVGKTSGSNVVSITTTPNTPPRPVTLAAPLAINIGSMRLSWSQNTDTDFASYRIYRSTSAGIAENQPPIAILNDPQSTSFDDVGLNSQATYYYRVFVHDQGDLSSGSNEVKGVTR